MLAVPQLPSAERPTGRPASLPPSPSPSGKTFADLLQRGQATHGVLARPAAPPTLRGEPSPRNDRDRDDEAPTETQRATRAAAAKAAAKPTPARDKTTPAAPMKPALPPAQAADGASGEERCVQAADHAVPTGAVQGADLRDWLASLKLQELPTADDAWQALAESGDGTACLAGGSGAASERDTRGDPCAGNESPATGTARVALSGGARPDAQAPGSAAGGPAERHGGLPELPPAREATPPLFSGASGAVPRGFDAGTLAPISLPTPLYAPDFAQALGAQISVFVRDGVQQAELHLNPGEMGPISVQIELDGKEARVDFSADTALTREIIERGLPELATALREQGFTLAGGGVFQRAPERGDTNSRHCAGTVGRSLHRLAERAMIAAPRPIALPVPQGRIDLYA